MTESKIYLTVFDENFELIGETPIPELSPVSLSKYFVKDGVLWVYINVEDEMGFVRITVDG
ncbi:hypothetical protein KIH41_16485 [Litoribacter ruber]|nr:hypothetical protein [Litoribacter ruber]